MKYFVAIGETSVEVDVEPAAGGGFKATVGGRTLLVDYADLGPREISLLVDGRSRDLYVAPAALPGRLRVSDGARDLEVSVRDERERLEDEIFGARQESRGPAELRAVMPGIVAKVLVKAGDRVAAGTALLTVEAMKMENEVRAEGDGVVRRVHVRPGQTVNAGEPLVDVGPPDAEPAEGGAP